MQYRNPFSRRPPMLSGEDQQASQPEMSGGPAIYATRDGSAPGRQVSAMLARRRGLRGFRSNKGPAPMAKPMPVNDLGTKPGDGPRLGGPGNTGGIVPPNFTGFGGGAGDGGLGQLNGGIVAPPQADPTFNPRLAFANVGNPGSRPQVGTTPPIRNPILAARRRSPPRAVY